MTLIAYSLTRPEPADLQEAINEYKKGAGESTTEDLLHAMLVIIGEACSQLEEQKKSPDEVTASLVASGLSSKVSSICVSKAQETVNSVINKDPERYLRETQGWNFTVGEIAFYLVAAMLAYILWP